MELDSDSTLHSLYEKDFFLWVKQTVNLLKNQDFQHLDLPNLIEEVEGLAGRDKRELKSRLTMLLEHALKRRYVNNPYDYRGWVETITREQDELKNILEDSPSLGSYLEQVFDNCYQSARKRLAMNTDYQNYKFPETYPFPTAPDQLLNDIFWE